MVACEGGVIVLTDSDKQSLQYISYTDEQATQMKGLELINEHLRQSWNLFNGCLDSQRDHYSNLSKISLESIEAQVEKQTRTSAAASEDGNQCQSKVTKV